MERTEPAHSAEAAHAAAGEAAEPTGRAAGAEPPARSAHDTVEAVVRSQLTKALGGLRGVIEAAVPTIGFTVSYVVTHQLRTSLAVGASLAVLLLAVRIIQRSNPQFVVNSLIGIGIAALFAMRSGKAEDAFLPGILYNSAYAVAMILSIVVRWPMIGFLVGSVTGDPTAWRSDPGIVRLCSRLTWLFVLPCVLRVAVQLPLYLGGQFGWLGASKVALGWPLQVAAFAAMAWVLARGRTPLAVGATPAPTGQASAG